MSTRRKFIFSSIVGTTGLISACKSTATATSLNSIPNIPLVISTWDFGQPANAAAWKILEKGGRALDAVEAGVRVPEADPNVRSVGFGGLPDRDGYVTLDACIMDDRYNCGSVMYLQDIMHPVSVARLVMEKTPHIFLAGEGAQQFALANGFKKQDLLTPESKKSWKEWLQSSRYEPLMNVENKTYRKYPDMEPSDKNNHDTIGMIAIDTNGNLSGACTTSGLSYKMHGRVGDSPIIGAGLYVDNEVGAATATGVGEEVIRIVGSHLVVELMRQGKSPTDACKLAVERIVKRNPSKSKNVQVGFLALNKKGEFGAYALQKGFNYAVRHKNQDRLLDSTSIY